MILIHCQAGHSGWVGTPRSTQRSWAVWRARWRQRGIREWLFQSAKVCRHLSCGHLRRHVATGYTRGMCSTRQPCGCERRVPGEVLTARVTVLRRASWGIMVCGTYDATGGGGSAGRRAHRHGYDCFPLITSAARAISGRWAGSASQPIDAKRNLLAAHLQPEQPSLAQPLVNGAVGPTLQVQS